ncbi:MAG: NrdH-redoxin, partial [Actinomyces sp.]|nr:NrdH-redoxin [Actinomyces sp.]
EFIKGLGYQQAPVVIAGEDHWSGYRPDLIKAAAQASVMGTARVVNA